MSSIVNQPIQTLGSTFKAEKPPPPSPPGYKMKQKRWDQALKESQRTTLYNLLALCRRVRVTRRRCMLYCGCVNCSKKCP